MGPKAKPAAKKKEGNPENGGELDAETKAKMFMLTCQSLQVQLGKVLTKILTENNGMGDVCYFLYSYL